THYSVWGATPPDPILRPDILNQNIQKLSDSDLDALNNALLQVSMTNGFDEAIYAAQVAVSNEIGNRNRKRRGSGRMNFPVCGAKEGKYKISIYEHGDDSYRLSVRIGATNSLIVTLPSRDGHVRNCSFVFKNKNDPTFQNKSNGVYLMWLDRNGRPSIYPDAD